MSMTAGGGGGVGRRRVKAGTEADVKRLWPSGVYVTLTGILYPAVLIFSTGYVARRCRRYPELATTIIFFLWAVSLIMYVKQFVLPRTQEIDYKMYGIECTHQKCGFKTSSNKTSGYICPSGCRNGKVLARPPLEWSHPEMLLLVFSLPDDVIIFFRRMCRTDPYEEV